MTYSKLKPEMFRLNKKYLFNGQKIEEISTLTVNQVQMAGVKEITSRDYFVD
jgi:hypothetical protein